jgi:hypothetical protein
VVDAAVSIDVPSMRNMPIVLQLNDIARSSTAALMIAFLGLIPSGILTNLDINLLYDAPDGWL